MSRLQLVTPIRATAERCFDLSCDIDVHVASMGLSGERAIGGVMSGVIGPDEEVIWEARHCGVMWRMKSRIVGFERPRCFVDEMQYGPFESFRHEHWFERHGDTTAMTDLVDYKLPFGPLGTIIDAMMVKRYLHHLLEVRNCYVKGVAEGVSS